MWRGQLFFLDKVHVVQTLFKNAIFYEKWNPTEAGFLILFYTTFYVIAFKVDDTKIKS